MVASVNIQPNRGDYIEKAYFLSSFFYLNRQKNVVREAKLIFIA